MKVRTICACVSTALLFSFSTSTVFADVSPVTERSSLFPSDSIYWHVQGIPDETKPFYRILAEYDLNVKSTFGLDLTVSQSRDVFMDILREPEPDPLYFRPTNFQGPTDSQVADYYLTSWDINYNTSQNPFTFVFSDLNDEGICGFGTQIAPRELGEFKAEIQELDGAGIPVVGGASFEVIGSTGSASDGSATFIGLSSTTAMAGVGIVVTSTADDSGAQAVSWYAVNQVTLTYCSDLEPQIPVLTCDGFAAPMAIHPVKAKKNRVFPLKMELFDNGIGQTDVELVDAPVVQVIFSSSTPNEGAVDVTGDALTAGQGSDGNQFDYTDDGIWQFNLKSKNHKAKGTYEVKVVSGDSSKYVISGLESCETSFIIK